MLAQLGLYVINVWDSMDAIYKICAEIFGTEFPRLNAVEGTRFMHEIVNTRFMCVQAYLNARFLCVRFYFPDLGAHARL